MRTVLIILEAMLLMFACKENNPATSSAPDEITKAQTRVQPVCQQEPPAPPPAASREIKKTPTQMQRSCDTGVLSDCVELGNSYEKGNDLPRDYKKARLLYQKACDGLFGPACSQLVYMHLDGRGLPKDPAGVHKMLTKACYNDLRYYACNILDEIGEKGKKYYANKAKLKELLQENCEKGFADSCDYVAHMYDRGEGIPHDQAKAKEFFQKACRLGYKTDCEPLKK